MSNIISLVGSARHLEEMLVEKSGMVRKRLYAQRILSPVRD